MTVLPLHEVVATRLCKTDGCEGDAAATRGRYAYLCDRCVERARAELQATVQVATAGPRRGRPSYEDRVRTLIPLARRLDRAFDRYNPARVELQEAMREYAEALEAMQT